MSVVLNISAYARVLIIDTQVVLETKPLDQLPWAEFGQGPILLLVCRQAQSEIDAKKNDGRLGSRARSFNKMLDSFLETRLPAELSAGPPRVDVALVANARIDWDALDDLDRHDGDDRIVAQALHALVSDRAQLELLSHDMRPRDGAITHGLRATKLPEHWLRAPEPSPDERERARLERELGMLRTEQPLIEVRVEAITPLPWRKLVVEPASDEQTETIQSAILRAAPRQDGEDAFGLSSLSRDYSFDERKRKWRDRLIAKDLPAMHLGLQRLHAQQRVRITIENAGPITAEGLSLEVRSGNTTLHSKPYYVFVFGKPAPYPRAFHDPLRHMDFGRLGPASRHEPFTFYIEEEGPGPVLIWSCSSFRQEKSFEVELSVELGTGTSGKAQVEAVVTARNMKGDVRAQLIAPIVDAKMRFDEVVDPATRHLIADLAFDPLDGIQSDDDVRWTRSDGSLVRKD
ncbi:MAG TPA: hypothetical protein VEC11_08445 [Allosphingosinicella sp.]|nr:hypothetical protein [Allosphingosinicella sp.]